MRKAATLAAVLALGAASAYADDAQDFAKIERGRYLATAGDCAGCHDEPGGGKPFAGGMAIDTPFGTVTASNITPDKDAGIGAWSDDEFVRALTHGIRRDGAHLFPAMPYPYYTKASPDDVLAIRAYLATVPAVQHKTGGDALPFPLDVRAGMAAWNEVNFTPGRVQARSGPERRMEPRRLSRRGRDALRRLPHAKGRRPAATSPARRCKAAICKAGSRPRSPAPRRAASAPGRPTRSSSI